MISSLAMSKKSTSKLSATEQDELLRLLQTRFESNPDRHRGLKWQQVAERLRAFPECLAVLQAMEDTGGEPDVFEMDKSSGRLTFFDFAAESPGGRRSLCYDRVALNSRSKNKPESSALDMAAELGITLLSQEQYRALQAIAPVDTRTSSWVLTPEPMRRLGGALFGDHRYGQVFFYHNGAESYYAARGFRGCLTI